jgi:hypothetical protein
MGVAGRAKKGGYLARFCEEDLRSTFEEYRNLKGCSTDRSPPDQAQLKNFEVACLG